MGELQSVQTAIEFVSAFDPTAQTGDIILPAILVLISLLCVSLVLISIIKSKRLSSSSNNGALSIGKSLSLKGTKALVFFASIVAVISLISATAMITKFAYADPEEEYQVNTPAMIHAFVDPTSGAVNIESGYIENASSEVLNISNISTYGFPGFSDGGATWTISIYDKNVYSATCGTEVSQNPSILLQPGQRAQIAYSVNINPDVAKSLVGHTVIAATYDIEKAYHVEFTTNYPDIIPYSPFTDIYVPSQGTTYTYHEIGEAFDKEVSVTINYGDTEISVFPNMIVEGWHNEYTKLNDDNNPLVNDDTGDITGDSKFLTTVTLNYYNVYVDLNGGDISWDRVPKGWTQVPPNSDDPAFTKRYKKTYYYGDVIGDILDPEAEKGWADTTRISKDLSKKEPLVETEVKREHYLVHENWLTEDINYPWDIEPERVLKEDTLITLRWDKSSYVEGRVYNPDGTPALDTMVEYWTYDCRKIFEIKTNMYGYYKLEVRQTTAALINDGVLKIYKETTPTNSNERTFICAPDLYCEPNDWTITMSNAHLQPAWYIDGNIKGNDTPINSENYDLEGVVVTLYTYLGDGSPESTFTTRTNDKGDYHMLYVMTEGTRVHNAVLEFYSAKFNSEYVCTVNLGGETKGPDFIFTNDKKLFTFDFNGGKLPKDKLPWTWKFNKDGNIEKHYQKGSYAGAIEQILDPFDIEFDDGDYWFERWEKIPDPMIQGIVQDTTYKAQWSKLVPVPTPVEGLVYNGESQIGVPYSEAYHITDNEKTDAGTYKAHAVLNEGYMWEDHTLYDRYFDWSIDQKNLKDCDDISIPEDQKKVTYTGEEFEPDLTIKDEVDGRSIIFEGQDYEVTGTLKATVVGNYTITVDATSSGNYKGAVFIDWDIVAQRVPLPFVNQGNPWTYTGEEIVGVNVEQCHDRYYYAHERGIEAKHYKFFATLIDRDNYVWDMEPPRIDDYYLEWDITQKRVAVPEAKTGLVFNTEVQTGVEYGEGGEYYDLYNNTAWKAGTYTCIASLHDPHNYCWDIEGYPSEDQNIPWKIARLKIPIPEKVDKVLVYNGKEQIGVPQPQYGSVYSLTNNRGVNAGTYFAIASLLNDNNYAWDDGSAEGSLEDQSIQWEIIKAQVEKPVATTGLVYSGYTLTGVDYYAGGDELFKLTSNTGVNAGDYQADATLLDPKNYEWEHAEGEPGSSDPIKIAWHIEQKNISDSSVQKSIAGGSEIEFALYGEDITPKVIMEDYITIEGQQRNIINENDYSLSGETSGQHVKSGLFYEILPYTIQINAVATGNYKGETSIDWKIIPHKMVVPVAKTNVIYNGDIQAGVEAPMGSYGYSLADNTAKNSGNYVATASVINTYEYPLDVCWDGMSGEEAYNDITIPWSIQRKDISKVAFRIQPNHLVYHQGAPLSPEKFIVYDCIYDIGGEKIDIITANDYSLSGRMGPETDVGEYPVTITASNEEGTNYYGTKTENWYIDEAQVNVPKAFQDLVFNGQEQTGVEEFEDAYYFNTSSESTTPDPSCIKQINAGTYTVWAHLHEGWEWKGTGSEHDKEPKEIQFSIAKKSLVDPSVHVNCEKTEYTYNRSQHQPEVTVSDKVGSLDIIKADDWYLSGDTSKKDVGKYTIEVLPTETGNYILNDGDKAPKVNWKIIPANVAITWIPFPSTGSFYTYYNREDQRPGAMVSGDIGSDDVNAEVHIDNIGDSAVSVGNYDAYAVLVGSDADNYKISEGLYKEFSIERRAVPTPPKTDDNVYDGYSHTCVWVQSGYDSVYLLVNDSATDAGDHTCMATLTDPIDYYWEDVPALPAIPVNYVIQRREAEISWDQSTLSLTYNTKAQKPKAEVSNIVTQFILPDDVSPVIKVEGGPAINRGTYTAYVDGLEGSSSSNYKLSSRPTIQFQINPVSIEPPIVSEQTVWDYDGVTHDVLKASTDVDYYDMLDYSKSHAGNYVWVASIKDKDHMNYVWSDTQTNINKTGQWYINQRSVTLIQTIDFVRNPLPYTGDTQLPELIIDDGKIPIDKDSDLIFENFVPQKDVGTYTFTIKGNSDGNYCNTIDKSWSIDNLKLSKPIAIENLEYNGKDQNCVDTLGQTGGFTVTNNIKKNAGKDKAHIELWEGYVWEDGTKDSFDLDIEIKPRDITNASVKITGESVFDFDNTEHSVSVSVDDGGIITEADYVISNNFATDAGEYLVVVDAQGTNYIGQCINQPSWKINFRDIYDFITWTPSEGFDEINEEFNYDGYYHGANAEINTQWVKDIVGIEFSPYEVNANPNQTDKTSDDYWYYSVITNIKGDKASNFFISEDTSHRFRYHIKCATVKDPVAKTGLVYNGLQQEDCVVPYPGTESLVSITFASQTNAGHYEATAHLEDSSVVWETGGRDDKQIGFDITPHEVNPVWDTTDLYYLGVPQIPNVDLDWKYEADDIYIVAKLAEGDEGINAGNHIAIVDKLAGVSVSNYTLASKADHPYVIQKRSLVDHVTVVAEPSQRTWTGEEVSVNVVVSDNDNVPISKDTDYTYSGNTGINVGEYEISVNAIDSDSSNYKGGPITAKWNIVQKQEGFINPPYPNVFDDINYDGDDHKLSEAYAGEVGVDCSGEIVYELVSEQGSVIRSSDTPIVDSQAGEYILRIYAKENESYTASVPVNIGTAVIKEGEITYVEDEEHMRVYTGDAFIWGGILETHTKDSSIATVKYNDGLGSDYIYDTPPTLFEVEDSRNIGFMISAPNHKTIKDDSYIQIEYANIGCKKVEDQTYFFNGEPQGVGVDESTIIVQGGMPYEIWYSVDGGEKTHTVPTVTEAGKSISVVYTIQARNHFDYVGEYSVEVIAQEEGKIDPPPTGVTDLVYNSEPQELTIFQEGTVATGDIHYVIDGVDTTDPVMKTDAGTYDFIVYAAASESCQKSPDYPIHSVISPALIHAEIVGDISKTYDGGALSPEVHASTDYGDFVTVEYSTQSAEGPFSSEIPYITDVSTLHVWYRCSAQNYETINDDYTLVIEPATISYTCPETQSQKYNGELFNGSGVTGIQPQVACDYTLKYGLTEGTYDLDDRPGILNVADSENVYFKIEAPNHKTVESSYYLELTLATITCDYGDQEFDFTGSEITSTITSATSVDGTPVTVKYKFEDEEEYTHDSAVKTNPGTYLVMFKASDVNHEDFFGQYNFTIKAQEKEEGYINPAPEDNKDLLYDPIGVVLADYGHDGQHVCSNNNVEYSETGAEGSWTSDVPFVNTSGIYTRYVKVPENDQYNEKVYGPITFIVNYKADFMASGQTTPLETQYVPRDNSEYKLTQPAITAVNGWWYFGDDDVKEWNFDTDIVNNNITLYKVDEVKGLDFYSLDQLKVVAQDISANGESSPYYGEFQYYCASGAIWYSHSNGMFDPENPDTSVLSDEGKCNFADYAENVDPLDQYLFLRIVGINHDYAANGDQYIKRAGLTFETVHAIPYSRPFNDDWKTPVHWGDSFVKEDFDAWSSGQGGVLPQGIVNNMQSVYKFSYNPEDNVMERTTDKLFVLSISEMHRYYSIDNPKGWGPNLQYLMPGRNPDNPYEVTFNPRIPTSEGFAYEWYIWDEYWSSNNGPYFNSPDDLFYTWCLLNSGGDGFNGKVHGTRFRTLAYPFDGDVHSLWKKDALLSGVDSSDSEQNNYHVAFCF